jgi:hypothetical protein
MTRTSHWPNDGVRSTLRVTMNARTAFLVSSTLALALSGGCLPDPDPSDPDLASTDAGTASSEDGGMVELGGDAGSEVTELDAGSSAPDAGSPAHDAGSPVGTACELESLRFEGTFAELEPTDQAGSLSIHFDVFTTALADGPCDSLGGSALPRGWWGQGGRHGRTAIVQSRQNGDRICAQVATAGPELLYEGTIAADCSSMSGTFTGTEDDGSTLRGTWTAELLR